MHAERSLCSKRSWTVLLVSVLIGCGNLQPVTAAERLVTQIEAARHGLQRVWFAQVQVDRTRHHITQWLLHHGTLFALTSSGTVQALDAETGASHWVNSVGSLDYPPAGMGVNNDYVALANTLQLHLLSRKDGRLISTRRLGGAASAAPAVSHQNVFVALLSGRLEGFSLINPSQPAWEYQSVGRIYYSPAVSDTVVSWPTTRGFLYVGSTESERVLFRVETNDQIVAAPAAQSPYLFVPSLDGYLYCVHDVTGSLQWKYSTGFPITSRPVVVGNQVFVASEGPTLHAVDVATGEVIWRIDGADRIVGIGGNRAYGLDALGTLLMVDKKTGMVSGRLRFGDGTDCIVNNQTDRLYLVSDRGFVQCWREIGADEPADYKGMDKEAQEETDQAEVNPFLSDDDGFPSEDDGGFPSEDEEGFPSDDDGGFPSEDEEEPEPMDEPEEEDGFEDDGPIDDSNPFEF